MAVIYQITNMVNNKYYIGSAESFARREWQHKYDLKRNAHKNPRMQAAAQHILKLRQNDGASWKNRALSVCNHLHKSVRIWRVARCSCGKLPAGSDARATA